MTDAIPQGWAMISGTVSYRERMALPPNAFLTVEVADVSRADAPAAVIAASAMATGGGQAPLPFVLVYNPNVIDDRLTYAISASIRIGDQIAWRTTSRQPVLSHGAPTDGIAIIVQQIPRPV